MKVRIGYGPGAQGARGPAFENLVDSLERLGFDSLWLSERATGESLDPLVGLATAAGRTTRLKLGTSVLVAPGRNPYLLAKQVASIDRLSGGRMLPAFGLGIVDPAEQQAFGVARNERSGWVEEALPLMRKLWTGERVGDEGPRFGLSGLRLALTPLQDPLDVWLGGAAPGELRRVGRLADGWLPSFCTPDDAASGRKIVEEAAGAAGRRIDPEHYGAVILYSRSPLADSVVRLLASRRPGSTPEQVIAVGLPAIRERVERFVERGFSKFVIAPLGGVGAWEDELEEIAELVLPLQSR